MILPVQNNGKFKKKFSETEIYLIVGFFGFLVGSFVYTFFTPNYYPMKSPVLFEVTEGEHLSEIIDSLYEQDIIDSRLNMKAAVFLTGAARNVKAGRYEIPNGLSYLELVDLLIEGSPATQKLVTIPEGIWQHKLASLFQQELDIDSTKFMMLSTNKQFINSLGIDASSLEGYLLPNTYYFYFNSTAENVITKLHNHLEELFDSTAMRRIDSMGMTKHEILTLASIIDGETNISSEFKTISGVYHNRLETGMPLQADPTVQYLIRYRKKPVVLLKDLEIDSPYNTYLHNGLPPGPINNPGKEAILAAIYPEKHNYYYFVADGTGGHKFARTLSEHLQNVNEYRRWQRKNGSRR